MTTTDQQTIDAAAMTTANLLATHWEQIKEWANDDEKLTATIGFNVKISFGGKVPKGVVNMSFASRVKDAASFSGEQLKLKGVA